MKNTHINETLQQLGLTENETLLYLAALDLGETSVTEISKHAKLKRPTAYLAIASLELLGLMSRIKKGKRNTISAVHPNRLSQIARFREKQLDKIIPSLVARHKKSYDKPSVQMFEGKSGAELVYKELFEYLSEGNEAKWIGNIDYVQEHFPELINLYTHYVYKAKRPKIKELLVDSPAARKFADTLNKKTNSKNVEVRFLPSGFNSGQTDQLILNKKIVTFSLGKQLFVISTQSEEISKTQNAIFDELWKISKK